MKAIAVALLIFLSGCEAAKWTIQTEGTLETCMTMLDASELAGMEATLLAIESNRDLKEAVALLSATIEDANLCVDLLEVCNDVRSETGRQSF